MWEAHPLSWNNLFPDTCTVGELLTVHFAALNQSALNIVRGRFRSWPGDQHEDLRDELVQRLAEQLLTMDRPPDHAAKYAHSWMHRQVSWQNVGGRDTFEKYWAGRPGYEPGPGVLDGRHEDDEAGYEDWEVVLRRMGLDPSRVDQWLAVHEARKYMTAEEQELFELVYVSGASQAEVVKMTGLPVRWVKSASASVRDKVIREFNRERIMNYLVRVGGSLYVVDPETGDRTELDECQASVVELLGFSYRGADK